MLKELLLVGDLFREAKAQNEIVQEKIARARYVRDITREAKKHFDLVNKVRGAISFGTNGDKK